MKSKRVFANIKDQFILTFYCFNFSCYLTILQVAVMSSFQVLLLLAGWVQSYQGYPASEHFITAEDTDFEELTEELTQFSLAGALAYNTSLKAIPGAPLTSGLRAYTDQRVMQVKVDIYLLEACLLQCETKKVAPVTYKNESFIDTLKKKLSSIKQELSIRWGIAENGLLALIMLNILLHIYSLSFIIRVWTYKKLVRK